MPTGLHARVSKVTDNIPHFRWMTARVSSRIRPNQLESIRRRKIDQSRSVCTADRGYSSKRRIHPASSIGLYGHGDAGKTSTLNLVEEALVDHSNVVVVRFNPWLYGSEYGNYAASSIRLLRRSAVRCRPKPRDRQPYSRIRWMLLLASFCHGVGLPKSERCLPRIGDSLAGVEARSN